MSPEFLKVRKLRAGQRKKVSLAAICGNFNDGQALMSKQISEVTRRAIIDLFGASLLDASKSHKPQGYCGASCQPLLLFLSKRQRGRGGAHLEGRRI
jgi:hypothetical protein